jgi:hypothetical protein
VALLAAGGVAAAAASSGPDLPDLALKNYAPAGREAVRVALAPGVAVAPGAAVAGSASRYRPSERHPALDRMARALANQPAQQESLRSSLEGAVTGYRKLSLGSELADDMASGLAMLVLTWDKLQTGRDLSGSAGPRLARQLQAAMKVPAIARLPDPEKQAIQDWSVASATLLLSLDQTVRQAGKQDSEHRIARRAGELVADLFGVPIERLALTEGGLQVVPALAEPSVAPEAPPPASPSAGRSAPAAGPGAVPVPEPVTGPLGTPQLWQDYAFIPPAGWSVKPYSDLLMMQAPPTQQAGESTFISLQPFRRAEADLASQAVAVAREAFAGKFGSFLNHSSGNQDLFADMERGVTGDGWRYVQVDLAPIQIDGARVWALVRVLLVRVGDRVAPIVAWDSGIRLVNEVSGRDVWSTFFFGLGFPNHPGPGPGGAQELLAGTWGVGGSNAMVQETYGRDGTYGSAAGYQTYRDLSATRVLETTHGFFSEGRYLVQGNRLTVWPRGGKPETHYFRIAEQANSVAAGGWITLLRQLQRSVDGQNYELKLTKHR